MQIIILALEIYSFILLARVLLSWLPNIDRSNQYVDSAINFLYAATEPVLQPVRELIPPERTGMIDLSPLVVFLVISVLIRLL